MNKRFFLTAIIGLIFFNIGIIYSQEALDGIVAIVDNEIILKSELDINTQLFAARNKANPNDPTLRKNVLNMMIEEKLVLAQADIDSIVVTDEEVNRQVEYQVDGLIQQMGSKEILERTYQMSLDKIKRELKDDVKKNLLVQKTQELHFGRLEVSQKELEEFYGRYKDSLGIIPEELDLSQISISPRVQEKVKDLVRAKAKSIIDSVKKGISFEELAKVYSEDRGTATYGGDLGIVSRGNIKEIDQVAFTMTEGDVSNIIETSKGIHIIKLMERLGDKVRLRHIFFKLEMGPEADSIANRKLSSIRDSILLKGIASFEDFARKYSDDEQTAALGGAMGKFAINELKEDTQNKIVSLNVNEISLPYKVSFPSGNYAYQIILINKRIPSHKMSLVQDEERIQQLALMEKKQKKYVLWIKSLKEQVYYKDNYDSIYK